MLKVSECSVGRDSQIKKVAVLATPNNIMNMKSDYNLREAQHKENFVPHNLENVDGLLNDCTLID